jgi:hypothetical protein
MPCCLILVIAILGPRIAIIGLALFTSFFERPFDGLLIPGLGFLFLPFTTLGYTWAINMYGTIDGWQATVVVLAVLIDLGVFGGGAAERKRRG